MKKLLIPVYSIGLLAASAGFAFAEQISITRGPNVQINSIGTLISSALSILLIIAAIAAFLFLILGGIQWITSGGDKAGLEAARNKITNAIVGLVIVAAAWAVMLLVTQFLGIEGLFSPGGLNIPKAFDSQTSQTRNSCDIGVTGCSYIAGRCTCSN